jgi:hypothetical protein
MRNPPTLKALHSESSLVELKLEIFRKLTTEELLDSLKLDQRGCLKARPDGTMIDGHHRIAVLRERGVDVNLLQHEIVVKQ